MKQTPLHYVEPIAAGDRDQTPLPAKAHSYKIPRERQHDLLYYETGFEQMHPRPEIHQWMAELGYTYGSDWHCHKRMEVVEDQGSDPPAAIGANGRSVQTGYSLEFPSEELMALFLLRWGEGAYRPTKHNWYGRCAWRRRDPL
jgi:hypothetical protein